MEAIGNTTLVLLLVLFVGLLVPDLFKKFRLPYVTVLILIGAALGPNGMQFVQPDQTIEFFGFLGFTFLMFLAGLETQFRNIRENIRSISIMAVLNGLIPLITGVALTRLFGYGWTTALMVGVIFTSSSVAIIFPAIRSSKLYKKAAGKKIIAAVVFEDVFSLVALAVVLQSIAPVTNFPLPVYFVLLILSFVGLRVFLPWLASNILKVRLIGRKETHEEQLQFVILVLIGVLALFSFLGVHPILGAFLVGILLSDLLTSSEVREKIHTLGYGLFVPVFFFIVGMEMDLTIFANQGSQNLIVASLVIGLIGSKVLSGYVAGKLAGLEGKHSAIFGLLSTTQLTTTLAATFAAASLDILDTTLVTAIILVSVITTIGVPVVVRIFTQKG